jgi:hypothetical protein
LATKNNPITAHIWVAFEAMADAWGPYMSTLLLQSTAGQRWLLQLKTIHQTVVQQVPESIVTSEF